MTYNATTPSYTLEIDTDRCSLVYGEGACTARLQGTQGYVPKATWLQGNAASNGRAYYDASNERLIVNDVDSDGRTPDVFLPGWREVARWNIGNGTDIHTARILEDGGGIEVSNVRLARSGDFDLPLEDDTTQQYRIRVQGNSTPSNNATSIPGSLIFLLHDISSAQYRLTDFTNISSQFGSAEINSGGGTLIIEKFNSSTVRDGQFRITRRDPNTNANDLFAVGGFGITEIGSQAQLLIGGASHAAIPETGVNYSEEARWNSGSSAVSGQANYIGNTGH